MIFVTVGSQLPFDRLIKTVDLWAEKNKGQEVYAQTGISSFEPQNIKFCQNMSPDEYNDYLDKADFIIAHAGMGTIISALDQGKKLLLLPRLASMGEHRNDHQLATAKKFSHFSNIEIAKDGEEVQVKMGKLIKQGTGNTAVIKTEVSDDLISAIKDFVN